MQIQKYTKDYDMVSLELNMKKEEVESYFRNYYINKTLPIRNLTNLEIGMVKYYKEIRLYSDSDIRAVCANLNVDYGEYIENPWLIPKALTRIPEEEYQIAMKYAPLILEPYLNYGNYRAPRLTPLSMEEIAMLLSNIAIGVSILPEDKINSYTAMSAMDRLLAMYDSLPKKNNSAVSEKVKELTPAQLEEVINRVTSKTNPLPEPIKKAISSPKTTSASKKKNTTKKGIKTNATEG